MNELKMKCLFVRTFKDGRQMVFGDSKLSVDQIVDLFDDDDPNVAEDLICCLTGFEDD